MKLQGLLVGLLAAMAAGCAADSGDRVIEQKLNAWVGQDLQLLIDAWGRPQNVYRGVNGNVVYVYQSTGSVTTPISTSTNYNISSLRASSQVSGGQRMRRWCRAIFEVDLDNVIAAVRREGNSCRSG